MAEKRLSANLRLVIFAGVFLVLYLVPLSSPGVASALHEGVQMTVEYAREHVLLCLVPALFIAGAIFVFLDQQAVVKYLGPSAHRLKALSIASVSGAILAVCSCTVLPIFKGIYRKGAGIGPASAFLYSGPAINILAVVLTTKVLGTQLGIARAAGAVLTAFAIGALMQVIFRKEDRERVTDERLFSAGAGGASTLGRTSLHLISLMGILIFINLAPPCCSPETVIRVFRYRFAVAGVFAVLLAYTLIRWFSRREMGDWLRATRDFAVQMLPLLLAGVFIAGVLLGRPGHAGIIPGEWIARAVGSESPLAVLAASVAGALMYFATLTEIPIMQGLLGSGMADGPALALLLAGPSLSLPSILVIHGELGLKKTAVYIALVIGASSLAGLVYGAVV